MSCIGANLDLVKLYMLFHITVMSSRGEHSRCKYTAPFAADSGKAASTLCAVVRLLSYAVKTSYGEEENAVPMWCGSVRIRLQLYYRGLIWDSTASSVPVGKDLDLVPVTVGCGRDQGPAAVQ